MTGVSLMETFIDPEVADTNHTDWATDIWGASDVQAAIAAIPEWIRNVDWKGPHAAVDDWILTGHSNGGIEP